MAIILPSRRSNRPDHPSPASKHRATFARQAAIDGFGPKAVRHLNGAGVVDHEPLDNPDEAVDGREALARWLKLAANLEDGEAAQIAYETANELRRVLGLSWADLLEQEVAQ